jgi:hypothetical protein
MSKINYIPEKCEHCGQSTTYIYALDRGTVSILKAFARFIGKKGINVAHVHKELLAEGYLTANQRSNIARPRAHGLVAKARGEKMKGNYVLTRKGAAFLRGEPVPKYAIMSKVEGHQIGYFEAEKYTTTIHDFNSSDDYWEGINYDIVEGDVIVPQRA